MNIMPKGRFLLSLWGVLVTLAAMLAVVVSPSNGPITVTLLILAPLVIWIRFRSSFNSAFVSPTTITAAVFYGVGVFGYLLRDLLDEAKGSGASVDIRLTETQNIQTLALIQTLVVVILLSSVPFSRKRELIFNAKLSTVTWASRPPSTWLLVASFIPAGLVLGDNGSTLFQRSSYMFIKQGSILGSLSGPLLIGSVLASGYIFGASRGGRKAAALLVLGAGAALLMSFGSRQFALIPLLFAVGVFVAKNTQKTRLGVALGAVLSFCMLPLPLWFRGAPSHGLLPYIDIIFSKSPTEANWLGALNNVLVAFDIIGLTLERATIKWSDLWISVNPLPGNVAGWYEISGQLRLNANTPQAAIGQLGNNGLGAVIVFGVLIGVVLAWLENVIAERMACGAYVYSAAIIGLVGLFSLNMIQYPLRSAARMLTYLVVLEISRRVLKNISNRRSENKTNSSRTAATLKGNVTGTVSR